MKRTFSSTDPLTIFPFIMNNKAEAVKEPLAVQEAQATAAEVIVNHVTPLYQPSAVAVFWPVAPGDKLCNLDTITKRLGFIWTGWQFVRQEWVALPLDEHALARLEAASSSVLRHPTTGAIHVRVASPSSQVSITVKPRKGVSREVDVDLEGETVAALRQRLCAEFESPASCHLQLLMGGEPLVDDEKTLGQCGIVAGATIGLSVPAMRVASSNDDYCSNAAPSDDEDDDDDELLVPVRVSIYVGRRLATLFYCHPSVTAQLLEVLYRAETDVHYFQGMSATALRALVDKYKLAKKLSRKALERCLQAALA